MWLKSPATVCSVCATTLSRRGTPHFSSCWRAGSTSTPAKALMTSLSRPATAVRQPANPQLSVRELQLCARTDACAQLRRYWDVRGVVRTDEAKEQRRERLPIRLPPATTRRSYDEKQMEQEKMLSELWPEPKKRPAYTEQAWGRTLWWTCVIISIVGTAFAAVGTLPYLAHQGACLQLRHGCQPPATDHILDRCCTGSHEHHLFQCRARAGGSGGPHWSGQRAMGHRQGGVRTGAD